LAQKANLWRKGLKLQRRLSSSTGLQSRARVELQGGFYRERRNVRTAFSKLERKDVFGTEAATVLHPWGQKAKLWRPLVQGQEPTRRPEDARKVELLCGHARQRKGLQRTMTVFFGVRNVQNGSAESFKKGKF
jgi:hypothetical protein